MANEIRSDSFPASLAHMREQWALQLTRANELERKLEKAEADRIDWQRIALENGERAARAEVRAERLGIANSEMCDQIAELRDASESDLKTRKNLRASNADGRRCIDWLLSYMRRLDADPIDVRAILDKTVGTDECECGGSGVIHDEEMVGDPSDSLGYRIKDVDVECQRCWDGRVAR